MVDDQESEPNQSGPQASGGPGGRHDAGATEEVVHEVEGSPDVGDGDGSDGDSKSPRRGEIAAARRAVAEVEEILDGEIQDPRRVDQIISEQHWEGPLPPPAALAAYERVLPGAADRAFTLAERNLDVTHMRAQTVRIAVEGEVAVQTITAEADRDALKRGQYLAAGISGLIGALSFGGLFLTPWAAIGFAVPLAQVAGALIRTVSDRRTPSDRGDEPPPNQGPSSELERSPGS